MRTASDEPATHTIEPHQDMAHNPAHPSKIAFFMVDGPPKGAGGETILVDMRAVTRRAADRGFDARFERKGGVRYAKKLWSDAVVDPKVNTFNWQRRYFTRDRRDVDAALEALPGDDVTWTWADSNHGHSSRGNLCMPCITYHVTDQTSGLTFAKQAFEGIQIRCRNHNLPGPVF